MKTAKQPQPLPSLNRSAVPLSAADRALLAKRIEEHCTSHAKDWAILFQIAKE